MTMMMMMVCAPIGNKFSANLQWTDV